MIDFKKTVRIESETVPGVSFTVRRLSCVARANRDMQVAEQQIRIAELGERIAALREPYQPPKHVQETVDRLRAEIARLSSPVERLQSKAAEYAARTFINDGIAQLYGEIDAALEPYRKQMEMPLDTRVEITRFDREMGALIDAHLKPATVRAGLVSIDGMEYDGEKPTAALLLENGPDSLIDEVWIAVTVNAALTAEQTKNSLPPSTSAALEGGSGENSTAATASETNSIAANSATAGTSQRT